MVTCPRDDIQLTRCATLMRDRALLKYTPETRYVCWIHDNGLAWCAAFEGWLGKTCRVHFARAESAPAYAPRAWIRAAFDYAFNQTRRELVFGFVSSANRQVVRIDCWLGFTESARYPGVHDDGADLIVFTMRRDQCRFLEEVRHGRILRPCTA